MWILDHFWKKKQRTEIADETSVSAKRAELEKKFEGVSGKMVGVDTAEVIVRPVISEKTAHLAAEGKYVFVVRNDANRLQVRSAIKSMYGVSPVHVHVLNVRGKRVRSGRRFGIRRDWKKAVVTLAKGQSISLHEGV